MGLSGKHLVSCHRHSPKIMTRMMASSTDRPNLLSLLGGGEGTQHSPVDIYLIVKPRFPTLLMPSLALCD